MSLPFIDRARDGCAGCKEWTLHAEGEIADITQISYCTPFATVAWNEWGRCAMIERVSGKPFLCVADYYCQGQDQMDEVAMGHVTPHEPERGLSGE